VILLTLGCLSDLSTLWGETDPSYESPGASLILADCEDGEMTVEAWVEGSDLAGIDLRLASGGEVFTDDVLEPDYADEGRWANTISAPCDRDWDVLIELNGPCESVWDGTTWSPPELGDLHPTSGPQTGGTRVTIALDLADTTDLSVEVGDAGWDTEPATDLVVTKDCDQVEAETCVLATMPAWETAEAVDIVVTGGGDTAMLHEGFTYHPDRSGEVVLYGRTQLITFDETWFWYGSPYTDIGGASRYIQTDFLFHEPLPEADHKLSHAAAPGECEATSSNSERVNAGTYVELDDEVLLMEDAEYYWWLTTEVDALLGHGFDLTLNESGTSTIEPQTAEDAFVVPELLLDSSFGDPGQPDFVTGGVTTIRGEDLVLTWTAAEDIEGLDWRSEAVEGFDVLSTNSCTVDPSGGSLTIPWSELVSDPGLDDSVDGIALKLSFWNDRKTTLSHDNSQLWTRSTLFVWTYVEVVDP